MYGSIDGITALAPAVGVIDTESTPTAAQVEAWLNEGAAFINSALSAAGYAVPVGKTAAAYPILRSLETLYATAYTLRARGIDVVQGQQESRSELYLKDFHNRLKMMAASDLTAMGLTLRTSPNVATRRGVRSMQLRRVDGYSAEYGAAVDPAIGVAE